MPNPPLISDWLHYDPETGFCYWKNRTGKQRHLNDKPAGSQQKSGYLHIVLDGKYYYVHRIAWLLATGIWPDRNIDHINGNKADNRWCNLRLANQSQNVANSKKSKANTSGFKGVIWSKQHKSWLAQIMIRRKHIHLGSYATPEAASKAYQVAAKLHFKTYWRAV